MLPIHLAAVGLATAALATSGCGGSSKTTSSASTAATTSPATTTAAAEVTIQSGKPLSRATWISRGDAICARTSAKLTSTTARTEADLVRLLPQTAVYERAEATELSKLVPPPSFTSGWQKIISNLEKISEYSLKVGEYARVRQFNESLPLVTAGDVLKKEMRAIARQDGFKLCSTQ